VRACAGCGGCDSPAPERRESRGGLFSQALGVLLPPGAGFALGYVLAGRGPAEPPPEGLRALAGLALMFLVAGAVCFFRTRGRAKIRRNPVENSK
jgi:hypothetical protein